MAKCTRCGRNAGFMMSLCDPCNREAQAESIQRASEESAGPKKPAATPPAAEAQPAAPSPSQAAEAEAATMGTRFRVITASGTEVGFADVADLVAAFHKGEFETTTLLFDERVHRWQPASEHDAIVAASAARPGTPGVVLLAGAVPLAPTPEPTAEEPRNAGLDAEAERGNAARVEPPAPQPEEQLYALCVGRNWDGYYRTRFHAFVANGRRFAATWNWAAALAPGWFLFRKLWIEFFLFIGLGWLLSAAVAASGLTGSDEDVLALVVGGGMLLLQGASGNFLLFRRAQHVIADVVLVHSSPEACAAEVARRGGVAEWVPWVFGVLAALAASTLATIAIPKFGATKGKAYVAAMKSDLRNLITAEEGYFADSTTYTRDLGTAYTTSAGVTVTINGWSGIGWSASARHSATRQTCQIYVGTPVIAGLKEGEPKCQ